MQKLKIIQSTTQTERVNLSIIHKLYEKALTVSTPAAGQQDAAQIEGKLETYYAKEADIKYLAGEYTFGGVTTQNPTGRFQNLSINILTDLYISFADPLVEQILLDNGIGDSVGVGKSAAANYTGKIPNIFKNTQITSFDELSQFGWTEFRTGEQFSGCTQLTSIDLNNISNFTSVSEFGGCTNLTTVKNFKLTSVPGRTFINCNNLQNIDLSNVTIVGGQSFRGCSSLNVTQNGLDFSKITSMRTASGETLTHNLAYTLGIGDVELPLCTSSINHVFLGCPDMTSIKNCPNITSWGYYNSSDHSASFQASPLLRLVDFSTATNSETTLRRGVFKNLPLLQIIKLPAQVSQISGQSIESCPSLQALVLYSQQPPTFYTTDNAQTFSWSQIGASNLTIYVPDATAVAAYEAAATWSEMAGHFKTHADFATDFPND